VIFQNRDLRRIECILEEIRELLRKLIPAPPVPKLPDGVKITQIVKGATLMSITGTNAGGQSTFEADALLGGVADPTGFPAGSVDTWTCPDPLVSIAPDSGPNNSQVVVSVAATDTAASYVLNVSVQMPTPAGGTAPAPLTTSVTVPIVPAPPPVPTGVVVNQIA
jgi:hypothetical protein